MVEIKAIIRRERVDAVKENLAKLGLYGLTHWHVTGRGKQRGVVIDDVVYDELPKEMLYIVVHDEHKTNVITAIIHGARDGVRGRPGDGRIFVHTLDEGYTISDQLI